MSDILTFYWGVFWAILAAAAVIWVVTFVPIIGTMDSLRGTLGTLHPILKKLDDALDKLAAIEKKLDALDNLAAIEDEVSKLRIHYEVKHHLGD